MADWNKNNLAHTNMLMALRILAQTQRKLAAAGEQKVKGLAFWVEGDSGSMVCADLDWFDYFTVMLGGSAGICVSYTTGRLPLDMANDRVFELGYQLKLP